MGKNLFFIGIVFVLFLSAKLKSQRKLFGCYNVYPFHHNYYMILVYDRYQMLRKSSFFRKQQLKITKILALSHIFS
ncbi:hypothetical protein ED312_18010 [Sinomicrobium pectinilyticum]|uniref:Uncharacterized protein n=1 Tax=Sinomicrobium pectinilyticum TaxID=1084421 RepID=A0A3N0E230_SINP1|nr:hypothetical protein ED312_18010 [Sinomicrobium pectinilyticum]